MKCPYCNADDTKVTDSRPTDNNSIRRRRECEICGKRFTTYEMIESIPTLVIKKNESRVPYDRAKLETSFFRACHKRPISVDEITSAVDRVEAKILSGDSHEIRSSQIGGYVMDELREMDDVAYVRFASVYKEFKDVDTFLHEIEKIAHKGKNK